MPKETRRFSTHLVMIELLKSCKNIPNEQENCGNEPNNVIKQQFMLYLSMCNKISNDNKLTTFECKRALEN